MTKSIKTIYDPSTGDPYPVYVLRPATNTDGKAAVWDGANTGKLKDAPGAATYRNSGTSEGTGSPQTITHGFAAAPKRLELIPLEAGVTFSDLTVDTDHFHVTVTNGKDWGWVAESW